MRLQRIGGKRITKLQHIGRDSVGSLQRIGGQQNLNLKGRNQDLREADI